MQTLLQIGNLFRCLGEVQGRKKLQKIVHILQEFGIPFGLRYGYLHYGPYSEELSDQIKNLKQDDLLEEEPVQFAGQFPTSRFRLTDKFSNALGKLGCADIPSWSQIAIELNSHSPRELEAISTLLYLKKSERDPSSIDPKFRELKPELSALLDSAKSSLVKLTKKYSPASAQ